MPKTVVYSRPKVRSVTDVPLEDVLKRLEWSPGKHVLVEFPEGIWKNPVRIGVGKRSHNPDYPDKHSQRYQWVGSPHEYRVPRPRDDTWVVNYMSGIYQLVGKLRIYESGDSEYFVEGVLVGSRPSPNRVY